MNTSFEINRENTTTTWLTPIELIQSLGAFDLDPCSPIGRPWDTARKHYTIEDDGLKQEWQGRVWLNPPYGKEMKAFLKKMALHGNGIALVYTRTETEQFQQWVFPYASALLFKEKRIHFLNIEGKRGGNGPGCGSVFIAYGEDNATALRNSGIPGAFIPLLPSLLQ